MTQIIAIDPVSRIGGHLRVEVDIDGGKVVDARVSGTLWRGIENILQGRDPRDAVVITQRICGFCSAEHALASVQSLDTVYRAEVPDNGRIIRNLISGANYIASHILHLYQLSILDYLDIMAIANYTGRHAELQQIKSKVISLMQAGDISPFTPRYEPDEFTIKDSQVVSIALYHYLMALDMRKKAQEMIAIFGGKMPHHTTFVPGGVTIQPTPNRIAAFQSHLMELIDFVDSVYLTDVIDLSTLLKPLHAAKMGAGYGNFLSFGNFDLGKSGDYKNRHLKSGVIFNGDFSEVSPLDPRKIAEYVKYSWYQNSATGKHPSQSKTIPEPVKEGAYSWLKAPRYDGKPMEVGPLARMLATQDKGFMELIKKIGPWPSIITRHVARAYECSKVAHGMLKWLEDLKPGKPVCDEKAVPQSGKGMGLVESAKGALAHFVEIENGKSKRYQCVVPTTWNCSPRDDDGVRGPVEQALIGTPVPDPKNPINVVRVVRSFDP
ncbi:MAG: nickel-dependent hydrogenase large subunit [Actinomycetota bacterium]